MLYSDKQCKVDSTTSRDESSLNLVNDCNGWGYNNERARCGAVCDNGRVPENNSESFNIVLETLTRRVAQARRLDRKRQTKNGIVVQDATMIGYKV